MSNRRAKKLRIVGIVVLALGIVGAGIIYWLGTRSPDMSGDLSMVGFDKPERLQMGKLYGKQGELIQDLSDDLNDAGTQAIIIVVFSAFVAFGCFHFARLLDNDDETTGGNDSPTA